LPKINLDGSTDIELREDLSFKEMKISAQGIELTTKIYQVDELVGGYSFISNKKNSFIKR